MDWLDLFAVQGTLKSLLQHDSSKASILQRSAFFIFQLSPPCMTTGKTIALTRWAFVGKVMCRGFRKPSPRGFQCQSDICNRQTAVHTSSLGCLCPSPLPTLHCGKDQESVRFQEDCKVLRGERRKLSIFIGLGTRLIKCYAFKFPLK